MTTPLLIKLPGCKKCRSTRCRMFLPCLDCERRQPDGIVKAETCVLCHCYRCDHNPAFARPASSGELRRARNRLLAAL